MQNIGSYFKKNTIIVPERVQQQIIKYQYKSEILIGYVQLVAVFLFGIIYMIAPKTFTEEAPFEPIPYTLAAYGAFTVIRLICAYKNKLANWFLSLSIVMDMSVLMITIWSFHIQYYQPAGFYFKAPTLLYVFIFISLRALRFEARWILLSGFFASLGWLILLLYALFIDPHENEVTRDFVTYMNSSKILIGAEIDKIVVILTVTFILALSVYRARRLLIEAVSEKMAVSDLSRFFAPEVAKQITSEKDHLKPGSGHLRKASIMFIDLRGFSIASETMNENELISLLSEYQKTFVPIIQKNNGSIDKFMGDGILASFGAVLPSDTYAKDAIQAATEIHLKAKKWAEKRKKKSLFIPKIGLALSTGQIIFGIIGDETRLEYTVIGDPVNLAAKLEKHTKQEKVEGLMTDDCYQIAIKQGYKKNSNFDLLSKRMIDGIAHPVDLRIIHKS